MPPRPPELVLASGSPRRRALLFAAGYRFEVIPPDVDETAHPGEAPAALVERLAAAKAAAVADTVGPDRCILGLDTVVVLDGTVLGKPADEADAVTMLEALSGTRHVVYTGYSARLGAEQAGGVASTAVRFRHIPVEEARAYVATGEPLDKAGAYALQGAAGDFVTSVEGSRSNVVGLPLREVVDLLRRFGIDRNPS